jgi:ectoine hydroxylase-related dioxygenase (phytanoyl-CoA dioxygenase family)
VPLLRHPAFDANRASPRIKGAFAQLLGTADLLTSVDQGGFNPPERPDRPFRGQGLHWDTSLVPPIPLDIQGILYLSDTPAEQGAFRCVPGFHRRMEAWLGGLPAGADPRAQDLSAEAVPVAGRAGDMVLWHAALPHGASPNRGTRPRLVQYIACFPARRVDYRPWR